MTIKKAFIAEIEKEAVSTKKILEAVKAENFAWKPHEKSMSTKSLAIHIAGLFDLVNLIVQTDELDLKSADFKVPSINNTTDLTNYLDASIAACILSLQQMDDNILENVWTMKMGDYIISKTSKASSIRTMALNHLIHHRGQLSVYLRLLNIPVPGMYGPSADEK